MEAHPQFSSEKIRNDNSAKQGSKMAGNSGAKIWEFQRETTSCHLAAVIEHRAAKNIWTSYDYDRFVQSMSEDDETRSEVTRRLFYLITVAAEDAATMAVEGQSPAMTRHEQRVTAAHLRASGTMIEILASAIEALASLPEAELP